MSQEAFEFLFIHLVFSVNTDVNISSSKIESSIDFLIGTRIVPSIINIECTVDIRKELAAKLN